jgi:hypothetical protein
MTSISPADAFPERPLLSETILALACYAEWDLDKALPPADGTPDDPVAFLVELAKQLDSGNGAMNNIHGGKRIPRLQSMRWCERAFSIDRKLTDFIGSPNKVIAGVLILPLEAIEMTIFRVATTLRAPKSRGASSHWPTLCAMPCCGATCRDCKLVIC